MYHPESRRRASRHVALPAARTWRRTLAAVTATVTLAFTGVAGVALSASAATVDDVITSVTMNKTSYGYNESSRVDFTWELPTGAAEGDIFELQLPDELKTQSPASFELRDPDGLAVATAAWSGKTVVFTLTDYVATHEHVHGTAHFTTEWDHTFITDTTAPVELEFNGEVIVVDIGDKPAPGQPGQPGPVPTHRDGLKGGWWNDPYQGDNPAGALGWKIVLPGNETGFAGPVTVTDVPGAGSAIDCDSFRYDSFDGLGPDAVLTNITGSPRLTLDCTPAGFTLTIDRIAPSEFIQFFYTASVTTQGLPSYTNSATFAAPGTSTTWGSHVQHSDAGGDGDGDTPAVPAGRVSVGDYVWLDTSRDGIQDAAETPIEGVVLLLTGPDGKPVTDVDGNVVPPTTTDGNGYYLFDKLPILPAGEHYTVAIDRAASAKPLEGLLPTQQTQGADRGVDSSTWTAESTDLTVDGQHDPTLDFGFVTFELPTLPFPEEPASTELAFTGTGTGTALPLAAAALIALLVGAGMLVARRIRA